MKAKIIYAKILILNLILSTIFSCEPGASDGQMTGDLILPCHDEWNVHYYNIDDEYLCEGEMEIVSIRENEKDRLQKILASAGDNCVEVEIKYYWLGIKLYTYGYIKNSTSTFYQYKHCK